ncbi:MAG TPA: amino acid permease [Cyclobacteriaceae bacterium]|jgi:APA family basic amino acid/polyamine antiporter|nr:amino acid permease [Cyclobacteriaceae bacterium]
MAEKLERTLNLSSTISLVAGGIIGSAIFMKPALMASQLGSPLLLLLVWVVGGGITFLGALTNAEAAAMMPETGGQYIFFQRMFGDFTAFLYGWSAFAVFNTAGNASIAYVFSIYAEYFVHFPRLPKETEQLFYIYLPGIGRIFPLENIGVKSMTIVLIWFLTYINYRSTHSADRIQILFSILKIGSMVFLVLGIFIFGDGSMSHFVQSSPYKGTGLLIGVVAATSGAFWGYEGWNNITFMAGEIKNPQRNIPLGLLLGLVIVIIVYCLLNFAYLYALPINVVASSAFVASDAASSAFGFGAGALIAVMVMISTFGATNGNVLATARVTFAMAQEKRFFSSIGNVHPVFKTPGNALLLHGVWTSLLVLSGSFDMLTDMLIFVTWCFYALSALGVMVLRKKMPNAPRPYKTWGYPFVPIAFISVSSFFLIVTLYNDISNYLHGTTPLINSLFGLALTAVGIPLYFYFKKKENPST